MDASAETFKNGEIAITFSQKNAQLLKIYERTVKSFSNSCYYMDSIRRIDNRKNVEQINKCQLGALHYRKIEK